MKQALGRAYAPKAEKFSCGPGGLPKSFRHFSPRVASISGLFEIGDEGLSGHTLILGGARSGKSYWAETLALNLSGNSAYIATAEAGDSEMKQRALVHQTRRGAAFTTVEEPLRLAETIKSLAPRHSTILVDCLTLWLSNLMFADDMVVENNIQSLLEMLRRTKNSHVILVSNEVGQGIVPDNALAREFRDRAGELHQRVAEVCGNVHFVTAGLPMALKGKLPELD